MENKEFKTEWCLLQNQFDSYEKHSLFIKLVSITALLAVEILAELNVWIIIIFVVLWIQDAIWKTFQSRIETRLLQLENQISAQTEECAFQFNSEYLKLRLTGLALISEYLSQSIRPTVAFPHIVLILMVLVQYIISHH